MRFKKWGCGLSLIFVSIVSLYAQMPQPLTKEIKVEVIDSLVRSLTNNYIYLDTATRMNRFIEKRLRDGAYDSVSDQSEFAQMLTADLRSVYNDRHLAIRFDPRAPKNVDDHLEFLQMAEQQNFGFKKSELLNGNAGYIRLDRFFPVNDESKETVRNALYFFRHARALIIDLRFNGGGDPDMVRYICSYFFPSGTEINDMFERRTARTEKFLTDSVERPDSYLTIPIYVLVSRRTFSGAEEFSYDMQQLRRATIIGEITGGGAHPVGPINIGNGFTGNIPFARPINPVSGTNWEAVGVKPEVKVNSDSAIDMALLKYYNQDSVGVAWYRGILHAKLYPVVIDTSVLRSYEGNYSGRKVKMLNDQLYFTGMDGRPTKLVALSQTVFKLEDMDDREFEFTREGIVCHFDDGESTRIKKTY